MQECVRTSKEENLGVFGQSVQLNFKSTMRNTFPTDHLQCINLKYSGLVSITSFIPFFAVYQDIIQQSQESMLFLSAKIPVRNPFSDLSRIQGEKGALGKRLK